MGWLAACYISSQWGASYHPLNVTNEHLGQSLTGFIAVTDILEGFGGILAGDVEEDFFSSAV